MCEQLLSVYHVKLIRVRVQDEVQKSVDEKQAKGICLGCDVTMLPGEKKRGQCSTCYSGTMRALASSKTDAERGAFEKRLIESGKLLPAGKPGRKSKNKYTKFLAELR